MVPFLGLFLFRHILPKKFSAIAVAILLMSLLLSSCGTLYRCCYVLFGCVVWEELEWMMLWTLSTDVFVLLPGIMGEKPW